MSADAKIHSTSVNTDIRKTKKLLCSYTLSLMPCQVKPRF